MEGWNGGKVGRVSHRGQNKKKICAFQKFHRITHQSDGKQQSTAAPLIRRKQLVGRGPSVILCTDSQLEPQIQINGDASMDRKSKGNNTRLLQVEVGVLGVGGGELFHVYKKK